MSRTYSTKEIADLIGIHVNTVRFYEEIGFLTPPKRRENGYRSYTDLQLEQCRLIRCAMKTEVLQNGLRRQAVEIVKLCAQQQMEEALQAADEYETMIKQEITNARAAIVSVEQILGRRYQSKGIRDEQERKENADIAESISGEENADIAVSISGKENADIAESISGEENAGIAESIGNRESERRKKECYTTCMKRQEAADALGVTTETLRTWERSGLIKIRRSRNGYRVYSAEDLERLNIVRTLRCANYSLSAILRLLNRLDETKQTPSIEVILNTPEEHEDIVSACDRLIVSLQNTLTDAKQLKGMLQQMKKSKAYKLEMDAGSKVTGWEESPELIKTAENETTEMKQQKIKQ